MFEKKRSTLNKPNPNFAQNVFSAQRIQQIQCAKARSAHPRDKWSLVDLKQMVDLTHPWSVYTWPFMDAPAPEFTDLLRMSRDGVMMRVYRTSMHVGTHIDAPSHFASGKGDMASVPLDQLLHEGVIVDVSDTCGGEWDLLYPEHVKDKVDVKEGDILIVHYGWHHYFFGEREPNEEKYFCYAPGPSPEFIRWMLTKKLRWFGQDTYSAEHPMNDIPMKHNRPDMIPEFEKRVGKKLGDVFPEEDSDIAHRKLLVNGTLIAENIGGDIDKVLNKRCTIGAFPWRLVGGDASICRVVAFLD